MEVPLTHRKSNESIAGKLCKCVECGFTAKCTVSTDFYTLSLDQKKSEENLPQPLFCYGCLWSQHKQLNKKFT